MNGISQLEALMAQEEHILGETAFYDAKRNFRFRNSMEIHIDLDRATWVIKGAGSRKGHTLTINNPVFLRVMALIVRIMQREARYMEPVQPIFKERTEKSEACPTCEGQRLLEDPETGEEWSCPACSGEALF